MKRILLIALLCLALLPVDVRAEEAPVDLDLSVVSGTILYSQVYNMMMDPDSYTGLRVKLRGNFSYFQDPDTGA